MPSTNIYMDNNIGPSSSTNILGVDYYNYPYFEVMNDMISYTIGVNFSFIGDQYDGINGLPNEKGHRFFGLLKKTNKLLFKGSPNSEVIDVY